MYKSRIKKWNFDKKTKEGEAWAILRMKMHRDAAGKESAFRVRGRTTTVDDVLRYFKRKGILNPEVEAGTSKASILPAIECWTPSPSPALEFTANQKPEEDVRQSQSELLEFRPANLNVLSYTTTLDSTQGNDDTQEYLNDLNRQTLFSSPKMQSFQIPHSPLPPQSLLVSEKLFASIIVYYSGAFNSGIFKTNEEGYLININEIGSGPVFKFYNLCYAGINLLDSKSFTEGGRCLSKASDVVRDLIQSEHPRTLECFLGLLIRLKRKGYNEIATLFRNLADGMAKMLFREEHPWRQMFSQIGKLDDMLFETALGVAWKCICDTFASFLGQFHHGTIFYYTTFVTRVHSPNDALQLLHNLLIRGEQELDKFDTRLLDIKFAYARSLRLQGRNEEAIAILEELLVHEGEEKIIIDTLEEISSIHYQIGHEHEAEFTLQGAIIKGECKFGKYDPNTLRLKTRLGNWLRDWGREAESSRIKAEIDDILRPGDIEL